MDNRPIGIFDSGVGGLTVMREIARELPGENLIYFGDTARVPYGSKSKETVLEFSKQIVEFLIGQDVKAVIAACNTVSSNCYEELSNSFSLPILEVVSPGVAACLEATENGIVGVIGTERTIASGAYTRKLQERNPEITVWAKACPLFVPLAEEGWVRNTVAQMTTQMYLQELMDREIDTLLLGCTHYPLLIQCIQETVGSVAVVNPAYHTAKYAKEYLIKNNMENDGPVLAPVFYVTDNTAKFDRMSRLVLGHAYTAQTVNLTD